MRRRVLRPLNSAIGVSYRSLGSNLGTLHDVTFANFWFRRQIFLGLCIDLELHELAVETTMVDIGEWCIFDTKLASFFFSSSEGCLIMSHGLGAAGTVGGRLENDVGCHFGD